MTAPHPGTQKARSGDPAPQPTAHKTRVGHPAAARLAAFRALLALDSAPGDLGGALVGTRDALTDRRDRRLTTELTLGTLRWRGALDYQLQRVSGTPLHRLDAPVLTSLRLGAYQLLYLPRLPAHAVVNDSVDLVRRSRVRSAAGLVNAVLRRLSRESETLSWPARDNLLEYLSVVHSHPAWLVERWLQRYGDAETEQWLRFNNQPPLLTLASNRVLTSRDELQAALTADAVATHRTSHAPHGLLVDDGDVLGSAAFTAGHCVVQDEASQLIPELVQAFPSDRVYDACAAPGGKTVALGAQTHGPLVAADVRPARVRLLRDTLRRCALSRVLVVQAASEGPLPFRDAAFDRVLVDAPCSGLGAVRRDPDIRWTRHAADLPALAATQRRLLQRLRPLLAPGGRLVYSTCSSEPEENEDVVRAFLAAAPELKVVSLADAGVPSTLHHLQTRDGFLRTTPRAGLEAFFAAILVRE